MKKTNFVPQVLVTDLTAPDAYEAVVAVMETYNTIVISAGPYMDAYAIFINAPIDRRLFPEISGFIHGVLYHRKLNR